MANDRPITKRPYDHDSPINQIVNPMSTVIAKPKIEFKFLKIAKN